MLQWIDDLLLFVWDIIVAIESDEPTQDNETGPPPQ